MVDRSHSAGPLQAVQKPPDDPLIGQEIAGRFRIVSLIARGGMGRVYRGRQCAIKLVNAGFGAVDPEFHRRFFLEASISSKLTHPNTVTIFDYGKTDDDLYFMAMELLEGRTLHRALREDGPFAEGRVLHIASQICRSLREAHGHNVIHRDLKPANIFLVTHSDEPDFVKVLDFGLVKSIDERPEEQLTQTGLFMGSPKYMAPEQIEGLKVDGRTDIYSLGIMMYEMLTGRVPFERASSVNTLMAHVHEPVPPLRVTYPEIQVSPALEAMVLRCMSKQVGDRADSMDELISEFKRIDEAVAPGPYESRSSWRARPNSRPPLGDINAISSVHLRTASASVVAVAGRASGASGPIATLSSSSQVPAMRPTENAIQGSLRPPALPETERGPSRMTIVVLVLLATLVGGALGLVLYRMSQRGAAFQLQTLSPEQRALALPRPSIAAPSSSVAPKSPPGPTEGPATAITVTTPPPSTLLTSPVDPIITVAVTSEPPGAKVVEGALVLCAATPCMLPGKTQETARIHSLSFTKPGFITETRAVGLTTPIHVVLMRLHAPAPGHKPVVPAETPSEPVAPGFKNTPY
jgi:eukaryotic-like serine/threonine-protein kinase